MISHEKKLVFIHVPKTGGKTLSKFLRPYCDEEANKVFSPFCETSKFHARIIDYLVFYGPEILTKHNYKIFSIARNPYDKVLSMHLHQNNNIFDREHFRKVVFEPVGPLDLWPNSHFYFYIKNIFNQKGAPPSEAQTLQTYPSPDRCREPDMRSIYEKIMHWPQILRFESYTQDVGDFLDYYGIQHCKEELSKKTNTTDHGHFSEYFLRDEIEFINWSCGLDFDVLGYELLSPQEFPECK